MARTRHRPEEIVAILRQVEVLRSHGMSAADATHRIGVSEVADHRWRKEYGGLGAAQLKRLQELEKKNQRLRRAMRQWSVVVGGGLKTDQDRRFQSLQEHRQAVVLGPRVRPR